jgi:hypothetical protein
VSNDTVVKLIQPGNFSDQLTDILRNGAHALLAQAVEAEVGAFLCKHADLTTPEGHRRVVRHGHLPEREVMTGIGPVGVRQPRVRDRAAAANDPRRVRFTPSILPPYARRSKSIETLSPILYLKGVRHRTIRSKGCLSNRTALAMVFKIVEAAQKTWRRLDGHNQLPKVVRGVRFADGLEVTGQADRPSVESRRRLTDQAVTKIRR